MLLKKPYEDKLKIDPKFNPFKMSRNGIWCDKKVKGTKKIYFFCV